MNTPIQPPDPDASTTAQRQALSDLMDGATDAAGAASACQAWRVNAHARQDWHAYQLIGDVLRTPELAPRSASADPAFVAALRLRLAQELIVIAPTTTVATPRVDAARAVAASAATVPTHARRATWRTSLAVAAGFAAVAVVVGGLPWDASGPAVAPVVADAPKPVNPSPVLSAAAPATRSAAGAAVMLVNDERMVRDAQLDRYLSAHRQYGGAPAMAVPGGVIRSVSATAPDR